MTRLIYIGLLASTFSFFATRHSLEENQLSAIMSCLHAKAANVGAPLLTDHHGLVHFQYHLGKFRFRYPTGDVALVGRDDEVRIAIYNNNGKSVVIYDVFVDGPPNAPLVEIAYPSKFHKDSGQWLRGDNPDGIAMDLYMRSLLEIFEKRRPQVISVNSLDVLPNSSCTAIRP